MIVIMSTQVTTGTAARMMNVSARRVTQLEVELKAERDPLSGHRRYDLEAVMAWIERRAQRLAALEAKRAAKTVSP